MTLTENANRLTAILEQEDLAECSLLVKAESLTRRINLITAKARRHDPHRAVKRLHDQHRDQAEEIYQKALKGVLDRVKAKILAKIRSRSGQGAIKASSDVILPQPRIRTLYKRALAIVKATETTPTEVYFNLDDFVADFRKAMEVASAEAYEVCAKGLTSNLAQGERLTEKGIVKDFVFQRMNKVKNCPQLIFDQIQKTLTEGDAEGETMDELTNRVQEQFDGIEKGRAFVIARTESQCAYGTAQMAVLKDAGYETKLWQTSDDELVRDSHAECEEQGAIGIDEQFSNGLDFPGDPEGEAKEVIGCRCYLIKGEPADEGEEEDDE
jgi:hypothetical protein